ncbi:MAG: hypothetical protein IJA34_11000 [Lachnospiraceae bacterium]|nr:hypothetical protein [Lachnospiraceae bacterium]
MNEEYGWIFSLIFKEIFHIHPSHNTEMGGMFTEWDNGQVSSELFSNNQLGNMKKKITEGKSFSDKEEKKVRYVIDTYFEENSEYFNRNEVNVVLRQIENKFPGLIESVANSNDIKNVDDIPNVEIAYKQIMGCLLQGCMDRNLVLNREIDIKDYQKQLKLAHPYFTLYNRDIYTYINNEINIIRDGNMDCMDDRFIKFVRMFFIDEILFNKQINELSDEDFRVFFGCCYGFSDLLDYTHDSHSYQFQLLMLSALNNRYKDDYSKILDIEVVRKLIGLTYGMAISENYDDELYVGGFNHNISLKKTGNGNLSFSFQEKKDLYNSDVKKLDLFSETLLNLVKRNAIFECINKNVNFEMGGSVINDIVHTEGQVDYRKIKENENLLVLDVVSLFASDYAAVHMNYLKQEKNPTGIDIKFHYEMAKKWHFHAKELRYILYMKYTDLENDKQKNYYKKKAIISSSNIIRLEYYMGNHKEVVKRRIPIYLYYKNIGSDTLADRELSFIKNSYEKILDKDKLYEELYNDEFKKYYTEITEEEFSEAKIRDVVENL